MNSARHHTPGNASEKLRALEAEMEFQRQQLLEKKATLAQLNSDVEGLQLSRDATVEERTNAENDYRHFSDSRTVTENAEERDRSDQMGSAETRGDQVSLIMEEEDTRKRLERSIAKITRTMNAISEEDASVRKRLVVVRLVSMLDELQALVREKMNAVGADGEDDSQAQDLFKAIQELSREREWALMMQNKKNKEVSEGIALKQQRIAELEKETQESGDVQQRNTDYELFSVAERIQLERRNTLDEIERIRETNDRLNDIIHETRYVASSGAVNRDTVMSENAALGGSANPEDESKALREKIASAHAERRRLQIKNAVLKAEMNEDVEKYTAKMMQIQKEIGIYQEESSCVEAENQELKAICDALALNLQD